jgi:hypothetical protein
MFCSQQVERKQAWIQSFSGEALASQRPGRRKRTHFTPPGILSPHYTRFFGRSFYPSLLCSQEIRSARATESKNI